MKPTKKQVQAAKAEIDREDALRNRGMFDTKAAHASWVETNRRTKLPSEDPEHIHGFWCDGQDGLTSYCERLRRKLFGKKK